MSVERNPDRRRLGQKMWREKNKERQILNVTAWRAKNQRHFKEYQRKYRQENKGKINAKTARRRAQKLRATVLWADLAAIKEFYKNCPEGHHVDHIIPLMGSAVCGLHVLGNLQYLLAKQNHTKSNKLLVAA